MTPKLKAALDWVHDDPTDEQIRLLYALADRESTVENRVSIDDIVQRILADELKKHLP